MSIEWSQAVDTVLPSVVRIHSPSGSGTGFLVSSAPTGLIAIATASHVIADAHYWEQPLKIVHHLSGRTKFLRANERSIFLEESDDTGAIVFDRGELPLPAQPLELAPEGKFLKVGKEIGWVGFPSVEPTQPCFFSGKISALRRGGKEYLVDGVAVNGVSGGPAFWNGGEQVMLIGVLSAYIPNRSTGATLPGLSVVQNVEQFHLVARAFSNIKEAKKTEVHSEQPPTAAPDGET
ncbi:MAG: hypothetical protein OMOMHJEC_03340 [Xanthomonadales bacterium]|nr:hypothetical protein [Xanthomonadales bacterium]